MCLKSGGELLTVSYYPPTHPHRQGRVFQKKTQTLKQKKRWENQRMKVIIIIVAVLVGAAVLGGIIYAIVSSSGGQ